jgi:hypothetical protein
MRVEYHPAIEKKGDTMMSNHTLHPAGAGRPRVADRVSEISMLFIGIAIVASRAPGR